MPEAPSGNVNGDEEGGVELSERNDPKRRCVCFMVVDLAGAPSAEMPPSRLKVYRNLVVQKSNLVVQKSSLHPSPKVCQGGA